MTCNGGTSERRNATSWEPEGALLEDELEELLEPQLCPQTCDAYGSFCEGQTGSEGVGELLGASRGSDAVAAPSMLPKVSLP